MSLDRKKNCGLLLTWCCSSTFDSIQCDVIVAFETVNAEAPTRVSEHLSHLVVHGCLHLLGFKHEKQEEANKMEALEVKILASLGYQNPYDLNYNLQINQTR